MAEDMAFMLAVRADEGGHVLDHAEHRRRITSYNVCYTKLLRHGGARREAERLGVPFLGEIPLDLDIRTLSDGGTPIVAVKPKSPQAQRFREIARLLIASPEIARASAMAGHA